MAQLRFLATLRTLRILPTLWIHRIIITQNVAPRGSLVSHLISDGSFAVSSDFLYNENMLNYEEKKRSIYLTNLKKVREEITREPIPEDLELKIANFAENFDFNKLRGDLIGKKWEHPRLK